MGHQGCPRRGVRGAARAAAEDVRGGLRRHHLARGVWRPGAHRGAPARLRRSGVGSDSPTSARSVAPRSTCVHRRCWRTGRRSSSRCMSRGTSWARGHLAQFFSDPDAGFRSSGRTDAGRARRRPLDPERVEDLEQWRVSRRHRHVPRPHRLGRAQAPRSHLVRRAGAVAWRHDGAHPPDQRQRGVLSGVLRRRRAHRRRRDRSGERRVDRHPDHVAVRAWREAACGPPPPRWA